jgi:hypothetical protein
VCFLKSAAKNLPRFHSTGSSRHIPAGQTFPMDTRFVPNAVIHQKTELTFNFQSLMRKRSFRYQA